MSTVVKNVGNGRRRIVGVVAALTIGGASILSSGAAAQAEPSGPDPKSGSGADRAASAAVLPHHKLPKGAVRVTGEQPRPGAYGPRFQKRTDPRSVSPKIVGGVLANAADHPWIIGLHTYFLGYDEDGNQGLYLSTCTGSVLSRTKVLTAGHCIVGLSFGTSYAIAGRNNLNVADAGWVSRVASTWTHQNFNIRGLSNGTANVPIDDVSVLTLKDPLPVEYTPIELTPQNDQTPYVAGTQALIVGYGITATGTYNPGVLRKATVPMVSDANCGSEYGTDYDRNRMVCAGNPAAGVDTCNGDSGGPIVVDGVQAGITDWGWAPCGSSYGVYERLSFYADAIKTDLNRPQVNNLDWGGDGHSDLIIRNSAGQLIEYSGSGFANDGFGGFAGRRLLNSGWGGVAKLFRVANWNGDGRPSIFAVQPDGRLYQYKNDGRGKVLGPGIKIGSGWGMFNDIMVTNNWLGNGRPSLLGRKPNGDLVRYTSNGSGGWLNPSGTRIGTGWNMFNTILTPGAWEGDGYEVLLGRKTNGDLVMYKSNGAGGWINPSGTRIGTGWGMFRIFMSPGDWNGDNMVDLIGITKTDGRMRLYTTNGYGDWIDGSGPQINAGWGSASMLF